MPAANKLTDLEALILSSFAQRGWITSYSVSTEFAESLNSRWSGSAGAIYPAVARLEKRKFLKSKEGNRGKRKHKTYNLTASGRTALRAWLRPPFPSGVGGAVEDPLRSRVFALNLLTAPQRLEFLDHAITSVQSEVDRLGQVIKEHEVAKNELAVLGLMGVSYELKGRLEWLRLVKRRIGKIEKVPV